MTGVRHLLLAVFAAVLALALGLALGAGPVIGRSDADRATRDSRLAGRVDRLEARVAELRSGARTDAKVVAALAGPLTSGRLGGHSVLLVRTPGARDALVRRTRAALLGAGASLTGELTITPTYFDPAKATAPLEDLALRLVPPNVEFDPGATAIDRVSTVLARSTVSAQPPDEPDADAAEVIAGLDELGAVHLDGKAGRLAELAVVITGAHQQAPAQPAMTSLVRALGVGGAGAVVAGPGRSPTAVAWWRAGDLGGAASVDSLDSGAGQVAMVLSLVELLHGGRGDYGAGPGATAVLPASVLSVETAG